MDLYKQEATNNLQKIISTIKNPYKIIIFDPDIITSINLTINFNHIKSLGVISMNILNDIPVKSNIIDHIYIIRPTMENCKLIISQIIKDKIYHIIFLPNKTITCERVFEYYGFWNQVKIYELPITLIPMQTNLLSIEHNIFRQLYLNNDVSPLFTIVKSLIDFQQKFGIIPIIQGIGNYSKFVIEELLLENMPKNNIPSKIGRLIIIDRETDLITPLITPTNYTSIVNEYINIKENKVTLTKPIILNDDVYNMLKYQDIDNAYKFIKENISKHTIIHKKLSQTKDTTIINNLIKEQIELPKQKDLENHLEISQYIDKQLTDKITQELLELEHNIILTKDYHEETLLNLMDKLYPLGSILRLLCLCCVVNDGIDIKHIDTLRNKIIKKYSSKYAFTIDNLLTSGLLFPKSDKYKNSWKHTKKYYDLFPDYYTPLSCRLIEYALTKPPKAFQNLKLNNMYNGKWLSPDYTPINVIQNNDIVSSSLLIFYIGGITYSEIATIKNINEKNPDKHIIIATTKIMSNKMFIESLI